MTALPVDNLGSLFFVIVYDLARLHQYRHLAHNHHIIIPASLRHAGCLLLSAFSVGLSSVFNGFLVLSSQAPCTVECRPLQRFTLTGIANGIDQGLVTTDMSCHSTHQTSQPQPGTVRVFTDRLRKTKSNHPENYPVYYRVTWGKAPPRGKAPLPSNYEYTYASGSIS